MSNNMRFLGLFSALLLSASAAASPVFLGANAKKPCGGGTCNTWSASDKDAGSTLSGGNLTATDTTGGATATGGRSVLHTSASKIYFEATTSGLGGGNLSGVGIASATAVFTGANCIACNATQAYMLVNGRFPWFNGSHLGGGIADIANKCGGGAQVDQFAIDLGAKKLWVNCKCGTWSDGLGNNGDPVAGTNGFDISAVFGSADAYAAYGFNGNNDTTTADFGATAMSCSVPSGYKSGWY